MNGIVANVFVVNDNKALIEALIEHTGISASEIARRAGLAVTTLTRPLNHPVNHRLSLSTLEKLKETYPDFPGFVTEADIPVLQGKRDYVPVEVLPTYVGAGGGGNGDAEIETALIPRSLIEDALRGKASDFLLINVRGDSMEPDFRHDDQILIDRRDTSPAQPGPFALWDAEWGEYLIKNVERTGAGEFRIFSSNPKYSSKVVASQETRIVGRPVWYGRRI